MKLCCNCKYFKPDTSWYGLTNQIAFGLCTHKHAIKSISYHSGGLDLLMASQMRHSRGRCGENAKYYIDANDIQPIYYTCQVFCTDCKYNKPDSSYMSEINQLEYAQCTHPFATTIDMISGKKLYTRSRIMRKDADKNDIKSCGADGFLFEAKDTSEKEEFTKKSEWFYSYAILVVVVILILLMI